MVETISFGDLVEYVVVAFAIGGIVVAGVLGYIKYKKG